jgi:AraC family transcriptional regulator
VIRTPEHVIMVTLTGGAQRLEVAADCGHRFTGPDVSGAVSFVPAHCERVLKMRSVESSWGSIALSPALFDSNDGIESDLRACQLSAFSNVADPFVLAMVSEFVSLDARDGSLDPTYCDAMSWALARHLAARYGGQRSALRTELKLPRWQLRRISEYVDAHLCEPLAIAELAKLVGFSPGYFHRSFKKSTGQTPLAFITSRRIQRAMEILKHETDAPIAAISLRVGFENPSYFTRIFRQLSGVNPAAFKRMHQSGPRKAIRDPRKQR